MARPRAAEDFAAIKSRLEELRRERAEAARGDAARSADETGRYPRSRSTPTTGRPNLRALRGLVLK